MIACGSVTAGNITHINEILTHAACERERGHIRETASVVSLASAREFRPKC